LKFKTNKTNYVYSVPMNLLTVYSARKVKHKFYDLNAHFYGDKMILLLTKASGGLLNSFFSGHWQASETLSGVTNGNQRYMYTYIGIYYVCVVRETSL